MTENVSLQHNKTLKLHNEVNPSSKDVHECTHSKSMEYEKHSRQRLFPSSLTNSNKIIPLVIEMVLTR